MNIAYLPKRPDAIVAMPDPVKPGARAAFQFFRTIQTQFLEVDGAKVRSA